MNINGIEVSGIKSTVGAVRDEWIGDQFGGQSYNGEVRLDLRNNSVFFFHDLDRGFVTDANPAWYEYRTEDPDECRRLYHESVVLDSGADYHFEMPTMNDIASLASDYVADGVSDAIKAGVPVSDIFA